MRHGDENPGTGISNKGTAFSEALDAERIAEAWVERTKRAKGKAIGTHSLGAEFAGRFPADGTGKPFPLR